MLSPARYKCRFPLYSHAKVGEKGTGEEMIEQNNAERCVQGLHFSSILLPKLHQSKHNILLSVYIFSTGTV